MNKTSIKKQEIKPATRVRRDPIDRARAVHDRIQKGDYPNAKRIAADLRWNAKTIRRDIGWLKANKMPVKYDRKRHGYFYSGPAVFPGAQTVNHEDILALIYAQKAVSQYEGASFTKPLQEVVRKLMHQLDPEGRVTVQALKDAIAFRTAGAEEVPADTMQRVIEASKRSKVLMFDYRKAGAEDFEPRRLHTYSLTNCNGRWYAIGHDTLRKELRTFALERMRDVSLSMEDSQRPKDFNLEEYLRDSMGIMDGPAKYDVVVELDRYATDLMRGRKWHHSQEVEELPHGSTRVRFKVNSLEEMKEWVLKWAHHATVIAPTELRADLHNLARTFADRYQVEAGSPSAQSGLAV